MCLKVKDLYIAKLSHENFSLAFSEFRSIFVAEEIPCDIELKIEEFIVFKTPSIGIDILLKRTALTLELGKLIDIVNVYRDYNNLVHIVKDYTSSDNVCLIIDSIKGFGKDVAKMLMEDIAIRKICSRKIISNSKINIVKISLITNIALIYHMLYRRRQKIYIDREPHRRPCYRPGTMKPLLARVFVNLARVSSLRSEIVLDPFCGVGGFAIEACLMGLRALCSDIDDAMIRGAKTNINSFGCQYMADVIKMDACFEAIANEKIDGIATDPPYGIQSIIPRNYNSLENLIHRFIDSAYNVLKKNRFMVFAIPINITKKIDSVLINSGFEIIEKHIDMVHGSLTRVIYMVKKI